MPASLRSASLKLQLVSMEDLDRVMEIERQVFTAPWSRESYAELIPQPVISMWVIKDDANLLGYMLYQLWDGEMELHTIAVDPTCQGQGLGRVLMQKLFAEAHVRGVHKIYLQVRVSNAAAIKLYESFGFAKLGLRKRYYQDNAEDAHLMCCLLAP